MTTGVARPSLVAFRAARDLLLATREDYQAARDGFRWPELDEFNWALDWFDGLGSDPELGGRPGLWIVDEDGTEHRQTFAELASRSNQVANLLRHLGGRRGDRMVLMLGNQPELWETLLAAIKLGMVVIPTSTLLEANDLADRLQRGEARLVVARHEDAAKFDRLEGDFVRVAVGQPVEGWHDYRGADDQPATFTPDGPTMATDPMLLYFTSGTTARPKLVEHTHASYPVGHLATMYWIGLEPGDVHLNISSPGWAKHAWSNVFAPWNAGACVFLYNYGRFDAQTLFRQMARAKVTSFCAPPTVWRMLIQADLGLLETPPRKAVGAGEPLNPEVIDQVQRAWGVTIRDGFGQTETTALVANTPGQKVTPGAMGRPLPGYDVELLDPITGEPASEGEICVSLSPRPVGLMTGYRDSAERTAEVMRDGYYHTGDVGRRDDDGTITYVGRTDDVFKASDYRISPFELESVLLEHEAVAEAAVVPSPDPLRLAVPKAYVVLAAGYPPDRETAYSILSFARRQLAPFKRVRRLEFAELPKTISGKIRRVELRQREDALRTGHAVATVPGEFADTDFPELRG